MKRIIVGFTFLTVVALTFLIIDWKKNKIEFKSERLNNGWYKYSNDKIEFEYPNKLRNCYECNYIKTGSIFNVMTDGEYIIMTMRNRNASYMISPEQQFIHPTNKKTKEIRLQIDSILLEKNIEPTDSFLVQNLMIDKIRLNLDSNEMKYNLVILGVGESIVAKINSDEFNDCGSLSWNKFRALQREKGNIRQFAFGSESGRFLLNQGNEDVFF